MDTSQSRVAVFIDGGNFYHKLKELNIKNKSQFGYRQLAEWLTRDRTLVYVGYYVGVVRAKPNDTKGQQLRAGQVGLFNFLRSSQQPYMIFFLKHKTDLMLDDEDNTTTRRYADPARGGQARL